MEKELEIKLNVNGEQKSFKNTIVFSEELFKESIKLSMKLERENNIVDRANFIADYMIYLFDEEFTYLEFVDGLELEEIFNETERIIEEVTEMIMRKRGEVLNFKVVEGGLV